MVNGYVIDFLRNSVKDEREFIQEVLKINSHFKFCLLPLYSIFSVIYRKSTSKEEYCC